MQQQTYSDPQMAAAHEMVQQFITYSVDNPHVMLGTYLRSLSIIAGLAMRMCEMNEEHMAEALEAMKMTVLEAYRQSEDGFTPATLQ